MLKLIDLNAVKKFVFECGFYENSHEYLSPRMISEWINAMSINEVEHLKLNLFVGDKALPSNIFTAKNIKVLNVCGGVIVGSSLSHVNLSLLQVLHLTNVEFRDFRSLGILLSGCVLLRDLVIDCSYSGNYPPLDIGGLNHLVLAEVPQTLRTLRVLSNVTSLRLQSLCSERLEPTANVPQCVSSNLKEFHLGNCRRTNEEECIGLENNLN
ncbi:hypothetical protein K1719_041323 [Acacia pycnantha]|nr:hypothetical protein K1719_041323 [Acacia pycnantha]